MPWSSRVANSAISCRELPLSNFHIEYFRPGGVGAFGFAALYSSPFSHRRCSLLKTRFRGHYGSNLISRAHACRTWRLGFWFKSAAVVEWPSRSRLPPLANHGLRFLQPFRAGRKARKHEAGLRLLVLVPQAWSLTASVQCWFSSGTSVRVIGL